MVKSCNYQMANNQTAGAAQRAMSPKVIEMLFSRSFSEGVKRHDISAIARSIIAVSWRLITRLRFVTMIIIAVKIAVFLAYVGASIAAMISAIVIIIIMIIIVGHAKLQAKPD
jgi:hypothetical protein